MQLKLSKGLVGRWWNPPCPSGLGAPWEAKVVEVVPQGPWEGWLGSAPNLTALSQKAHADVGQGKTAKKSEPDLKTAVEEMGRAADGGSRATGKMVKTLMRPGVPVQLLPPPPGTRASSPMA